MKSVLRSMRFLSSEPEGNNREIESLVESLWNVLKIPEKDLAPKNSLMNYLAAILNTKLIFADDEEEHLGPWEISRIATQYHLLAINRKSNKQRKIRRSGSEADSFRPSLCDESIKMAETRRQRFMPNDSTSGDHISRLAEFLVSEKRKQEA